MARVSPSSDIAFDLADRRLPDASGEEHRLGDLWAEQTVVLVHLRHFGCILCRHYCAGLREHHREFEARGARLVAVGTGGRQYAAEFVREQQIPFLVLVDKHLETHELIGIKRGLLIGVLKPKVLVAAARALAAGERQGETGPNPFLYGAANVIGAGGRLRYSWINDDYQDNAPVGELLDAAGSTQPAPSPGHETFSKSASEQLAEISVPPTAATPGRR